MPAASEKYEKLLILAKHYKVKYFNFIFKNLNYYIF